MRNRGIKSQIHVTAWYNIWLLWYIQEGMYMRYDMTKPSQWVCTERRLWSTWASAQSDQSSLAFSVYLMTKAFFVRRTTHTHTHTIETKTHLKIELASSQLSMRQQFALDNVVIRMHKMLKRLSLQYEHSSNFFYFLFKSFVKEELSYVFTINLFTIAENCTEKWIIL